MSDARFERARNRVDFGADIAIDATEAQDITSDSNVNWLTI